MALSVDLNNNCLLDRLGRLGSMARDRRFSERIGVTPIKTEIQIRSMDEALRNTLWNLLTLHCWDKLKDHAPGYSVPATRAGVFFQRTWVGFLKWRLDEKPHNNVQALKVLREQFFTWTWDEVYDFIEFTAQHYPFRDVERDDFLGGLNLVLERELSGYRFVGGVLTPITSAEELASIEEGLNLTDKFAPVRSHLQQSLILLSDRQTPDYRNSVKESICAVEALVQIVYASGEHM